MHTLLNINIYLTQVSGERLWEISAPLPPQVQIAVNVNVLKIEMRWEKIEAPFVFTVNYSPAIAQIILKGKGEVKGEKKELDSIITDFQNKKVPVQIIQAVSSSSMAEAILVSKAIGVPPPLPTISTSQQKQKHKIGQPGYTM